MRALITNCPNCGAPLKDGWCEYCNTHVRMANELDVDFNGKPTEVMLHIKNGDSIIAMPLIGRIDNVQIKNEYCDYEYGRLYVPVLTERQVEFTFSGTVRGDI